MKINSKTNRAHTYNPKAETVPGQNMYTLCALNYIVLDTLFLLLIICLRFMVDIFAGSGQCYQVFESVIQNS